MRIFQSGMKFNGRSFKIIFSVLAVSLCGATVFASGGGGSEAAEAVSKWHDIDTYKVLNFGILAIALFFLAKKPVKEFFTSRIKGIEEELADLEKKKKEASEQIAKFEEKLKDLGEESEQIVATYIKQGEEAKKRILEEAELEAEKLEEMAKHNIELEFKTAKAQLRQEISEKAILEAKKLIQESISSEDQDKLVSEYLTKVVA